MMGQAGKHTLGTRGTMAMHGHTLKSNRNVGHSLIQALSPNTYGLLNHLLPVTMFVTCYYVRLCSWFALHVHLIN